MAVWRGFCKATSMMRFIVLTILVVPLFLSACSGKTRYDIKTDKKTGIIFNEEWDEVYDEKLTYYNQNRSPLNIRKGPGNDFDVIGYLKPEEGGFVRNCNFDLSTCYMEFGGSPPSGWVNMQLMTQGDVEYVE